MDDVLASLAEVVRGIGHLGGRQPVLRLRPGEKPGEMEVLYPVGEGAEPQRLTFFSASALLAQEPTALARPSGRQAVVWGWALETEQDAASVEGLLAAGAFRPADVAWCAALAVLEVMLRYPDPPESLSAPEIERVERCLARLRGWTAQRETWYRSLVPGHAHAFGAILDGGPGSR